MLALVALLPLIEAGCATNCATTTNAATGNCITLTNKINNLDMCMKCTSDYSLYNNTYVISSFAARICIELNESVNRGGSRSVLAPTSVYR